MSIKEIDEKKCRSAVLGGAFLGGGGGGSKERGLKLAELSVECGKPQIKDIDEVEDSIVVTVSTIGAPAAEQKYVKPAHYVKAIELFENHFDMDIAGMISSESGAVGTINGWFQSSILGIPVLDAPCDGRAHPTGTMGSIGLDEKEEYNSLQTAVGGDSSDNKYVECSFSGKLDTVSNMVRDVSSHAGGLVAVVRNPVSLSYVEKNAALGSIDRSINIGRKILNKGISGIKDIVKENSGEIIIEDRVKDKKLETKDGFDKGKIELTNNFYLDFWNEFMTLEEDGKRIATFPDLIFAVDSSNGVPLTTDEISIDDEVLIGYIPEENISLGSSVKNEKNLEVVEKVFDKKIF